MRIVCFEQAATLEVQKERLRALRFAASEGFCSFLHLVTGSYGHCVTSKVDSSEERNPIPQDYCTGRAAENRQVLVGFLILKRIPMSAGCNLRNTTLHLSAVLLKCFPMFPNPLKVLCSLIYRSLYAQILDSGPSSNNQCDDAYSTSKDFE